MQTEESRPPTYTIHKKINSIWIKESNISCETINILEENIGSKISDVSLNNIFADISPRAKETRKKINKRDYIKLKSFCTAKETISKIKRDSTVWENIFSNDIFHKELISKIFKEVTQLDARKTHNPI